MLCCSHVNIHLCSLKYGLHSAVHLKSCFEPGQASKEDSKGCSSGKVLSPGKILHGLPLCHLLFLPWGRSVWTLESRQEWQQKVSLGCDEQRNNENIILVVKSATCIAFHSLKGVCSKLALTKARALTTVSRASQNTKCSVQVST